MTLALVAKDDYFSFLIAFSDELSCSFSDRRMNATTEATIRRNYDKEPLSFWGDVDLFEYLCKSIRHSARSSDATPIIRTTASQSIVLSVGHRTLSLRKLGRRNHLHRLEETLRDKGADITKVPNTLVIFSMFLTDCNQSVGESIPNHY